MTLVPRFPGRGGEHRNVVGDGQDGGPDVGVPADRRFVCDEGVGHQRPRMRSWGLAWDAVRPLITERLGSLGVEVRLYVAEVRGTGVG